MDTMRIEEGHYGEIIWSGLWDNGRRNTDLVVPDAAVTLHLYRSGDWNDLVVRAEGNHIQVWFKGTQTVDYTETDEGIETLGMIGFQAYVGPSSEVRYRNLYIKKL